MSTSPQVATVLSDEDVLEHVPAAIIVPLSAEKECERRRQRYIKRFCDFASIFFELASIFIRA